MVEITIKLTEEGSLIVDCNSESLTGIEILGILDIAKHAVLHNKITKENATKEAV